MMKWLTDIEYVGWIFWGVASIVLIFPNYFLSRYLIYDYSPGARIGLTVASSAIMGAILAWIVNEVLYRRQLSKYKENRKKERKRKKKNQS